MQDFLKILSEKPMTLIMSLPSNDPALAKEAWNAGADVMKVHINVSHRASGTQFKTLSEERKALEQILMQAKSCCGFVGGGSLADALKDYKSAAEMGFNFISLYAHHMAPEILLYEGLTKMVALDQHYTMEQVRSLSAVGADVLEASIMNPATYGQPLSVQELLQYESICAAAALPVVVPTQRAIRPQDVQALYNCGVKAVMIGAVVTGNTRESIGAAVSAFRDAIDSLKM